MSSPITLKVNNGIATLTQNAVDLLASIKSTYVVPHSKEKTSGYSNERHNYLFGAQYMCEHQIEIDSKALTANLKICLKNGEFITAVFGKTNKEITADLKAIQNDVGFNGIIEYSSNFQGKLDERFGKGLVEASIRQDQFYNAVIHLIVDITVISDNVINIISELFQHTDLKLNINPSRHYSI
jgi:hypothetical protein